MDSPDHQITPASPICKLAGRLDTEKRQTHARPPSRSPRRVSRSCSSLSVPASDSGQSQAFCPRAAPQTVSGVVLQHRKSRGRPHDPTVKRYVLFISSIDINPLHLAAASRDPADARHPRAQRRRRQCRDGRKNTCAAFSCPRRSLPARSKPSNPSSPWPFSSTRPGRTAAVCFLLPFQEPRPGYSPAGRVGGRNAAC